MNAEVRSQFVDDRFHSPVMVAEVTSALAAVPRDQPDGFVLDATVGGGGHAVALLAERADLALVGIDRDPEAVSAARERLARFDERVRVTQARFGELDRLLAAEPAAARPLLGALFDFGVSSHQLDTPARGFSYRHDGPLDMTMGTDATLTAADVVNDYDVAELARVLRDNADERFAARIARAIDRARPLTSTLELADVVTNAIPAATRRRGRHPARRAFAAIRMEVNDELSQIVPALRAVLDRLVPGGRAVTLTYHSKEDRMAKLEFQRAADGVCFCPASLPCICGAQPSVTLIPKGGVKPTVAEVRDNPRAASARMRVAQKLAPAAS